MTTLRHISFRRLGTSDVHQRYLEDDRDIVAAFGKRARNVQELLRRAPTGSNRVVAPQKLSEMLLRYAEKHGAPEPVRQNARAIAEGSLHVIVTGQQPGLLGGPLYNLHKVATTIRLCREINALADGPRVVPLFWNHSDDHDFDEANRTVLVNSNQDVQRFRLEMDRTGEALRFIAVGRELERLLASLDSMFPQTPSRDWALELHRPRHPDETFGDLMARQLFALFGKHGLLILEPRDLPAEAFAPLERWWGQADTIRDRVRVSCDELGDLGIDVTMDPAATLMFQVSGGQRVPMAEGDQIANAADLSPGAMLRPLWQDACLPTLGFVVGPGELSYLAVTAPLYRTLGVPMPVLVPRASMTLVEPAMQRLLKKFNWDLPELNQAPEQLAQSLVGEGGANLHDEVLEVSSRMTAELDHIQQKLERTDNSLVGALDRARTKSREELQKLAQKLQSAQQNREGTGIRQVRRLVNNLRPRGRMQERSLPALPFLVQHGAELADWIVDAADPFRTEHGVLEL